MQAFCVSLAAHRHRIVVVHSSLSPSHHRRPIVVIVITAIVFHLPIIVVAIAAIIVVGVIVVAVAVVIDIVAPRHRHACRAPWLSTQGIPPKQAKAVSPMAWGWSASPWICRRVADGIARTTSCQRCRPVRNIMVLSPGGWRKSTRRYSVFTPSLN